MPRLDSARSNCTRSVTWRLVLALMLVLGSLTFGQMRASAAGTTLFNEPFHDDTVDGTGAVFLPGLSATGTVNVACLSASGNAPSGVLTSCPSWSDSQGSGKLRLTSAGNYLTGDGTLTDVLASLTSGANCPVGGGCGLTVVATVPTMTLTGLTPGFSLSGLPGTTAELDNAVTMTVTTKSPNGYSVTAQAVDPALTSTIGDGSSIPIAGLEARAHGATAFVPLSTGTPFVIHSQASASAQGGDTIGTDYEVLIPNVESGSYSGRVEYVAMAL